MSDLLNLPRELREEILRHATLPPTIYTSSIGEADKSYVDSRIFLPSHPPASLLASCRQLRQECLEHHAHLLNSGISMKSTPSEEQSADSTSNTSSSDGDFDLAAEQAVDDGVTLRLTLEVQRGRRGQFGGHHIPDRTELSPRFLSLLPLIEHTRKLKLVIWPGFDWWNGPSQTASLERWRQKKAMLKRINAYQVGHTEPPSETQAPEASSATKIQPDAVSVAIEKILEQLPVVEELDLNILIATGDLFRWDLPDVKWEKIQPWLDGAVTKRGCQQLRKVSRRLISVWQKPELEIASHQPFYIQKEKRSDVMSNTWCVERQGGWRAPMFEHIAQLAALELPEISIDETFERVDADQTE
ncbi:hypothetical protein E8E13_006461 [Curvularia kusanoi]|uniref:Uncharacterized protein n=1 Tax=Curvularia kusanoi TaxID=90978 RepID=A0A9P4T9Q5_CURKU|nr:hypothetical protein E8E13_006461 [Curvularia kusanoi]